MSGRARAAAIWIALVFGVVLGADLLLVAAAGTDVPFLDQWDVEGAWLYPRWLEGLLTCRDLIRPLNEHRIAWTQVLDLILFTANGQWDPLVQLVAIALLRATVAAGLLAAVICACGLRSPGAAAAAFAVTGAFLPVLAWHSVLWGIESQVSFVLGLSVLTLLCLAGPDPSWARTLLGVAIGLAALLAMALGALVPIALLALVLLRVVARRRWNRELTRLLLAALILLGAAVVLHIPSTQPRPGWRTMADALVATLGWPHPRRVVSALVMNAPLALIVLGRIARRRDVTPGEDQVLAVGAWSVAVCFAAAWGRGGSGEFAVGVPSRYADFLVLLPLVNVWCLVQLTREAVERWRSSVRIVGLAWLGFAAIGWVGLSSEMLRQIIVPRARDRDAPVRLLTQYQETRNAAVFTGQPRLLVPHPNLTVVQATLDDPRMRGHLPPSVQPTRRMGPLSRATRWLLGRPRGERGS